MQILPDSYQRVNNVNEFFWLVTIISRVEVQVQYKPILMGKKREKTPYVQHVCFCLSLYMYMYHYTGFVRVLENLESPGILLWHFPGLESPGKRLLVLESSGNLLNSAKSMKRMEGSKGN